VANLRVEALPLRGMEMIATTVISRRTVKR
jgi:hypothetical protein